MSSSPVANLENFLIPLEVIESATEKFLINNEIAWGEYSKLYKVQLSESWGNRTVAFKRFIRYRCDGQKEFLNELKVISISNHENIIPFLGYSDEGKDNIVVYGYPANGSLASYLRTGSCLTWQHRLEICLDTAKGLNYLHSGLGQHGTVIHGSLMAENILLDDNLKAKICGFEISELIPSNQPCKQVYKPDEERLCELTELLVHRDPIYLETGFLNVESDIFSFGVLLFKILTWPEAFERVIGIVDHVKNSLTMKVQHQYHNKLDSLIDPAIRDQIGSPSFHMIEEIACKCISYNIKERPTMDTVVKKIQEALDIHNREAISVKGSRGEYRYPREFHIPSEEIPLFYQTSSLPPPIFGDFYTAELSHRWPKRTLVLKQISQKHELTTQMINNEIDVASRFHHKNIIPYIGYCSHGPYVTLIYEHAINGSLRDHLQDKDKLSRIPWEKRLKICLGAARGLKCLHSGLWDENRLVVHRHIRSEYILLDENMEAKISNFGLSIFLPRKKPQVSDYTYNKVEFSDDVSADIFHEFSLTMDPIYKQSDIVNTEVDVYSFGLVMFEILSGSVLQTKNNRGKPDLIRRVHRHYGHNEMDKLIDSNIRDPIDGRSLQAFAETAYRCLSYNIRNGRR